MTEQSDKLAARDRVLLSTLADRLVRAAKRNFTLRFG
jgi:hypothetical protein